MGYTTMKKLYEILDTNYNDYHLGFEVQSPEKEFISWDKTYAEILALPCVERGNAMYSYWEIDYHCAFKYPVRVGNLLLKYLGFDCRSNQRHDVAVQSYRFMIDKPYCIELKELTQIKNILTKHLEEQSGMLYYEIGFDFQAENDILYHFYYWQKSKRLSFEIINRREYPHLLLNENYENKMQISDYLVFDGKGFYSDNFNYKGNASVKRRPPLLTEKFGEKPVLWSDRENNILGIANEKFANFIAFDQIESVSYERMLPAKGGGGDFFHIKLKGEKYNIGLFSLNCRACNYQLARSIERIFGKTLMFNGEYNDC